MTKETTNLNPALKESSHLWDEILKTQAHRMPKQLILLINEIFQKTILWILILPFLVRNTTL